MFPDPKMAILLLTCGASWQQIANSVLGVGDRCKREPHYLWVERPSISPMAAELERLLGYLDLEEQWAYIEDVDQSTYSDAIVFDASKHQG